MSGFLYRFKFYFVFIFAVAVISFNASFDSNDPDYLEAQKNDASVTIAYQTPLQLVGSRTITNTVINKTDLFNPAVLFSMVDTFTIAANPGPANNGGSPNWAIFFDLITGSRPVNVTQLKSSNGAAAGGNFTVEVFVRDGTSLGGSVSTGPGSSMAGWTSIGTAPAVQGPTASGISELITIPAIMVAANDTVGVAVRFTVTGPRYFGTGSGPYITYSDTNLRLVTGDVRSAPFTTTGSYFAPRFLTGEIRYVLGTPTGIGVISTEIPGGFSLAQNYPNPFNPATTIEFAIPNKSNVTLKVYNAQGREVTTLANGEYSAGTYSVRWDAAGFASGVYFYSMQAGSFSQTKKLLLVK